MNEKERLERIGRMHVEFREAQQTRACVQHKLDEYAKTFKFAQDLCRQSSNRIWGEEGQADSLTLNIHGDHGDLHRYILPKPHELADSLNERKALDKTISRLQKQIDAI